MKALRIVLSLCAFFLLAAGSTPAVAGKAAVVKLAIIDPMVPTGNPSAAASSVFKSELEARTNGDIKVKIYPSGTLGSERETIEQVKAGITQSYLATFGGMAPFYPLIELLNTPFLYDNIEDGYAFYDSDVIADYKEDIRKKTGLRVMGFIPLAMFQFTNSVRPIRSPADMKGLKMRTMPIPLHMRLMKSLGASATPIAWSEIYTSLQTGVVEGQHNPMYVIKTSKLYEVQKYMTISNHMPAAYCWVVNDKWFASLSPNQQDTLNRCAQVAITAAKGIDRIIEASESLKFLNEHMEVYTLTPDEKKSFKSVIQKDIEDYFNETLDETGKEFYRRIKETAARINQP